MCVYRPMVHTWDSPTPDLRFYVKMNLFEKPLIVTSRSVCSKLHFFLIKRKMANVMSEILDGFS